MIQSGSDQNSECNYNISLDKQQVTVEADTSKITAMFHKGLLGSDGPCR